MFSRRRPETPDAEPEPTDDDQDTVAERRERRRERKRTEAELWAALGKQGAKVYIQRFNEGTGVYAHLCATEPNDGTLDWLTKRYGGGRYKWYAKKGKQFAGSGTFEIDELAHPPIRSAREDQAAAPPATGLDPNVSALVGIVQELRREVAELKANQAAPMSGANQVLETAKVLSAIQAQTGAGQEIVKAITLGMELRDKAEGGRSWADVALETLPRAFEFLSERAKGLGAMRLPGQPQPNRPARRRRPTVPGPMPGTPVSPPKTKARVSAMADAATRMFLGKMIRGAKAGDPPEMWADTFLSLAPEATVRRVVDTTAAQVVEFVAAAIPQEKDWLSTPAAVDWTQKFLDALTEPGEDEDLPEGADSAETVEGTTETGATVGTVETGAETEPCTESTSLEPDPDADAEEADPPENDS